MSLADLFMPTKEPPVEYGGHGRDGAFGRNYHFVGNAVAPNATDTDIRARAYTLARQELPDAPVEDVMCRAETIAKFLKGETA